MKAKVTKANLLAALERVATIVPADLMILKNVLIETKEGRISLATTNLAEFVCTSCFAEEVQQEGKALVNVQKLTEVVKELPKGTLIEFSLKEKLTLKGSGFRCSLLTSPLDSFPAFPAGEDNLFVMKVKVLKEVLERTASFAAENTATMFINGVLFQKAAGEKIVAVATDTHRMSVVEKEKALNASSIIPEKGVVIPKDGIRALLKLFDGFHKGTELAEMDVAVGFNGEMCTFKIGDTVLKVRLFEGNFPDYKKVLSSYDKTFMVNRESLISALTRMELMDKTVDFKGSGDTLTLSSNDSLCGGDAEETLEIDGLKADFSTAFNSNYLIEALNLMDGNEKVIFGFTIVNAGFTIIPEKMDGFRHIVMPCRSH